MSPIHTSRKRPPHPTPVRVQSLQERFCHYSCETVEKARRVQVNAVPTRQVAFARDEDAPPEIEEDFDLDSVPASLETVENLAHAAERAQIIAQAKVERAKLCQARTEIATRRLDVLDEILLWEEDEEEILQHIAVFPGSPSFQMPLLCAAA